MGGVGVGASQRVTLWRLTPIEEWSGKKATYDAAELVQRYEQRKTWRGDRTAQQVQQGARIFVLDGKRRVYRWGSEKL